MGSNNSWRARMLRLRMLAQGRFRRWNDQNIEALQSLEHLMTPQSRQTLHQFARARKQSGLLSLLALGRKAPNLGQPPQLVCCRFVWQDITLRKATALPVPRRPHAYRHS